VCPLVRLLARTLRVLVGGGVLQRDRLVDARLTGREGEDARDEAGQEAQKKAPDQQGAHHAAA
jgi:hypothetical protein